MRISELHGAALLHDHQPRPQQTQTHSKSASTLVRESQHRSRQPTRAAWSHLLRNRVNKNRRSEPGTQETNRTGKDALRQATLAGPSSTRPTPPHPVFVTFALAPRPRSRSPSPSRTCARKPGLPVKPNEFRASRSSPLGASQRQLASSPLASRALIQTRSTLAS